MKYEKLSKINTKTIVISLALIIIIGSVLILNITKAKYKTTISVPIVNGTIKYTGGYDFKIMALYQHKDDKNCNGDECYEPIDEMPESGYEINKEKSYCTIDGKIQEHDKLETIDGKHTISQLKKNEKCYLYFDKEKTFKDKIVAKLTDEELAKCPTNFDSIENTTSLICKTEDDFGDSYYFRGKVKDNWVKFGKMGNVDNGADIYWRIIRINGDGSIRLIYAGNRNSTSSLSESDGRINGTDYQYNSIFNDNKYVGYQFDDTKRGHTLPSNAYTQLMDWFEQNLLDEFEANNSKIDKNVGFCVDRSSSTNENEEWKEFDMNESGGTSTTITYYGGYLRLKRSSERTPTLKCGTAENKNSYYFTYEQATGIESLANLKIKGTQSLKYPIGLITADEAAFAGGQAGAVNSGYWLYTGKNYWALSPAYFTDTTDGKTAMIFYVDNDGIINSNRARYSYGLRPVINLKADAKLTLLDPDAEDKGTSTNPYIVSN